MAHRVIKRLHHLARQGAAGCVGNGARNHNRQAELTGKSARLKLFLNCKYCDLAVEGVEYCLNEQYVSAAVNETAGGVAICVLHFIKIHGAKAWIVYIRRQRQRAVHRAQHASNKARAFWCDERLRIRDFTREFGALEIQLVGQRLHVIVSHGYRG